MTQMRVGDAGTCVGDAGMHAGDAGTRVGYTNACLGPREACWVCGDMSQSGGPRLGVCEGDTETRPLIYEDTPR